MIGQQLHSEVMEPVSLSLDQADNWTQTGAVNGITDIYQNTNMSDFEAPLFSVPAQEIPDGNKRKVLLTAALGMIVAVFAFAYYFMGETTGLSWADLSLPDFITSLFKSEESIAPPPVALPEPKAVEPVKEEVYLEYQEGNPYWAIPNPIIKIPAPYNGAMTANDEELWRQGMVHPYVYQHYKTVMEITQKRLSGSHHILWEIYTSQDRPRKFWTRMRAAAALADFGYELSIDSLAAVIVGQRSEMMANYFRRFVKKATPGDVYLAKQLLKVSDSRTRAVALQILSGQKDKLSKLYVVAALLDSDPRIAKWAERAPAVKELPKDQISIILEVIQGKKPISYDVAIKNAKEEAAHQNASPADAEANVVNQNIAADNQVNQADLIAESTKAAIQENMQESDLNLLETYQPDQQEVEFYQTGENGEQENLNQELDEINLDEMTSFDLTGGGE